MVVIQNKAGQLANRLFAFAHFIGNAIEHDYRLVNPGFDEYCQYFPSLTSAECEGLRISTTLLPFLSFRLFRKGSELLRKRLPASPWHCFYTLPDGGGVFNLQDATYLRDARQKLVFMHGWEFRDQPNLIKHRSSIRALFTPDLQILESVVECRTKAMNRADVLVGVHVRRGDYACWQNGIYLYADSVYRSRMMDVERALKEQGKTVSFVICSNDVIDMEVFSPLQVTPGPGHAVADLYVLASCDLIMGPPSTYSLWASYHSGGKLLFIKNAYAEVRLTDFEVLFPDVASFTPECVRFDQ